MRIITGKYKGHLLTTIPDRSVRPATDRVKGAIFNVLQNRLSLIGVHVLDLFAGSGSLGFEALSRGAASIIFIDSNRAVLRTIEANAGKLDCMDSCQIIESDALAFLQHHRNQFDLIFADPPYAYTDAIHIPGVIFRRGLLKMGGFLIIEHAKRTTFEGSVLYRLVLQKEFGGTRVSFFAHPS